jgi:hypothetical protein
MMIGLVLIEYAQNAVKHNILLMICITEQHVGYTEAIGAIENENSKHQNQNQKMGENATWKLKIFR